MKNNLVNSEFVVSIVLVILLVLFLNPFNLWMPNTLLMMMLLALLLLFVMFAGFIFREHSGDEREVLHKHMAGRIGFLAGALVLVIGIIIQELNHNLDPWLVWSLGLMVLAKMSAFLYSRRHY